MVIIRPVPRVVKAQHTGDEAQGGHDGTPRHAGRAHGEHPQQEAEQDHRAQRGQLPIEHLGHGHHKEHLGEHRAAQVDVGEQGNPEVHHVAAEHLGLVGAPQGHASVAAEDMVPTAVI